MLFRSVALHRNTPRNMLSLYVDFVPSVGATMLYGVLARMPQASRLDACLSGSPSESSATPSHLLSLTIIQRVVTRGGPIA